MTSLVQIAQFYELADAICARSYLDSHEIYSLLQNEHHIQAVHWHALALGGYRLVVFAEDADEARRLLKDVSDGLTSVSDNDLIPSF